MLFQNLEPKQTEITAGDSITCGSLGLSKYLAALEIPPLISITICCQELPPPWNFSLLPQHGWLTSMNLTTAEASKESPICEYCSDSIPAVDYLMNVDGGWQWVVGKALEVPLLPCLVFPD